MNELVDLLILGPEMYVLIVALAVITLPLWIWIMNIRYRKDSQRFDRLMSEPKFKNKQEKIFVEYSEKTDNIKLVSYIAYTIDEGKIYGPTWIVSSDSISITENFEDDLVIPFYDIHSITIDDIRKSSKGKIGYIHIWRKNPPWWARGRNLIIKALVNKTDYPSYLWLKPFQMEAALEIKRRHEEYIANQF